MPYRGTTARTPSWKVFVSKEDLSFLGAVLVAVSVALAVSLETTSSEIARLLLLGGGVVSVSAWLALILVIGDDDDGELVQIFGLTCAICVPLAALLFGVSGSWSIFIFVWNLLVWNLLALGSAIERADNSNAWEKTILGILVAWSVSSTFIFIGELPWIKFSEEVNEWLHRLSILADLRILLILIAAILAAGTAVFRAFFEPQPSLESLSPWKLPVPARSNIASAAIGPILIMINVLLLVVNAVTDLLWKTLKHLAIFFGRVGTKLAELGANLLSEGGAWFSAAKVSLGLVCLCSCLFLVNISTRYEGEYLLEDVWSEQLPILSILAGICFGILICLWLGTGLAQSGNWKEFLSGLDAAGRDAVTALGWILMVFFVAGLMIYGIGALGLQATGFSRLGLFSLVLTFLIVGGIAYAIHGSLNSETEDDRVTLGSSRRRKRRRST